MHLYANHMEQTALQLSREPRPLPQLVIKRKPDSIFDYRFEDFEIQGYDPHPASRPLSPSEGPLAPGGDGQVKTVRHSCSIERLRAPFSCLM